MSREEIARNEESDKQVTTRASRATLPGDPTRARRDERGRIRAYVSKVLAAARHKRQTLAEDRKLRWRTFRIEVRSKLRAIAEESLMHRRKRTAVESGSPASLTEVSKAKIVGLGKSA